jgi:L-seryl-tRNA(Ser) seleniumtransferase
VLRVHASNYRIVGFTAQPAIEELVSLAHERGALVIDDLGSGALADLPLFVDEPSARESLRRGVDIVTFSGDKLLGGPQAGLALGTSAAIARLRTHPLARAVRIDKLNLAALDALLRLYLDPLRVVERVPTLALLTQSRETLGERAARLRQAIGAGEVVASVARAGAGALPVAELPSVAVALAPGAGGADELAGRLRRGSPAVLGYLRDDRLLLDVLTVRDHEIVDLAGAVLAALAPA